MPHSSSGNAERTAASDPSAPRGWVFLRRRSLAFLNALGTKWRRHVAWHVVVVTGVGVAALLLFAKVGEDVFQHETGSFDDAVRNWMLAHRTPGLFRAFTWVTIAGSTGPILVATALACLWLWRSKGRHAAAGTIAAPVLATALFNVIKFSYARVRPAGALHFAIRSYAFPSGHATVSMAAATTIAYVMWRERLASGRLAFTLAATFTVLVGLSRVYLDVHWTTDVLGGWSVGLFVAALAGVAHEHLRRDVVVADAEGVIPSTTAAPISPITEGTQ